MTTLLRIVLAATLVAVCGIAQDSGVRREAWPKAVLDELAVLPIQENGRVKPLDTVLQFAMYRIHHKRAMHLPDEPAFGVNAGKKLQPIDWGLDTMFFPGWADTFPAFTLEDTVVLETLGLNELAEQKRKRDRFSMMELAPGRAALRDKIEEYRGIEKKNRTRVQNQVLGLGSAYLEYLDFRDAFDFARARYEIPDDPKLRELFGDKKVLRTSDVLRNIEALIAVVGDPNPSEAVSGFIEQVDRGVRGAGNHLHWIPPKDPNTTEWLSVGELFQLAFEQQATAEQITAVERAEAFADSLTDPTAITAAAAEFRGYMQKMAEARGEYGKVEIEYAYYRFDSFYKALLAFLGGFFVLCVSWLLPKSKWLPRGVVALTLAGNLLVGAGIVWRCIVRDRPPVLEIYDTIPFIAFFVVTVALVIEWINRRRVALAVAAPAGWIMMMLLMKFELVERRDNMDPPLAVLDTNFWLATHVTTVTLGYGAGILAGLIGAVFLLGKLVGFKKGDRPFYNGLTRMVYGTICFGVLLSTVGTILGGIWANDSWGRFWGWDPKENGALMVVLWYLMILHARLGGMIKNFGVNIMAIGSAVVVAFSWWHVNELGKGLHSYGRTEGVLTALYWFYGTSGTIAVLGMVAWVRERLAGKAEKAAPADEQLEVKEEPAPG